MLDRLICAHWGAYLLAQAFAALCCCGTFHANLSGSQLTQCALLHGSPSDRQYVQPRLEDTGSDLELMLDK